ncbi:hypothetical protein ENBRE01_1556 [Enteropsectra breve]|nr:hypothetical protein ENBRE01_1556 [Enteropsectra breve]
MGFVNKSCLSTAEFLFEVFSETNILSNGEEMAKIKEDLVISEEIKNQAVYNAADIKRGGYRLFGFNISFKDISLNIKELVKNDASILPFGLKYLKDLFVLAVFFGAIGFVCFSLILNGKIKIKESKAFFTIIQNAYLFFYLLIIVFYTGNYLHRDADKFKRRLKRNSYSIPAMICSGLIYNIPFPFIAMIMNVTVLKAVFVISGAKSNTLGLFEIMYLILQCLSCSILQMFFSMSQTSYSLAIVPFFAKAYCFYHESYDWFLMTMFCQPNITGKIQSLFDLKEDSAIYKIISLLLDLIENLTLGLFSPHRHLVTAQVHHYISNLKSVLGADWVVETKRTEGSISLLYRLLNGLTFNRVLCGVGKDEIKIDSYLVGKLDKASTADEIFSAIQKGCSKKASFFGFGKTLSLLYVCVTIPMLIAIFACIVRRRFSPEVRLKL